MATKQAAAPAPEPVAATYEPETRYDVDLRKVVSFDGFDFRPHPSLVMTGELLNGIAVEQPGVILDARPVAPRVEAPTPQPMEVKTAEGLHVRIEPGGAVMVLNEPMRAVAVTAADEALDAETIARRQLVNP